MSDDGKFNIISTYYKHGENFDEFSKITGTYTDDIGDEIFITSDYTSLKKNNDVVHELNRDILDLIYFYQSSLNHGRATNSTKYKKISKKIRDKYLNNFNNKSTAEFINYIIPLFYQKLTKYYSDFLLDNNFYNQISRNIDSLYSYSTSRDKYSKDTQKSYKPKNKFRDSYDY